MPIFPLELVRGNPRFLGCLPQKQDEKIAMCESWCYSHHNTVDSTLVLSAFVTKKFRRSDTPYPPFSGVEEWSLPQIFEIFKRKNVFSEGESEKKFGQKILIESLDSVEKVLVMGYALFPIKIEKGCHYAVLTPFDQTRKSDFWTLYAGGVPERPNILETQS